MTSDIQVRDPWHEADEILSLRADIEAARTVIDRLRGERDRAREIAASFEADIDALHVRIAQFTALETYWQDGE